VFEVNQDPEYGAGRQTLVVRFGKGGTVMQNWQLDLLSFRSSSFFLKCGGFIQDIELEYPFLYLEPVRMFS
jgi:hypothetical protein